MKIPICMFILCMIVITTFAQEVITQAENTISKVEGLSSTLAVYAGDNLGATVLSNNTIFLFSLQDGKEIKSIPNQGKPIRVLTFQPDGKTLAGGDSDGNIILWSVFSGNIIFKLTKHKRAISCLEFTSDGKFLASSAADLKILIWSVLDSSLIYELQGHSQEPTALFFSHNQNRLASISRDGTVKIWGTPKLEKKSDLPAPLIAESDALNKQGDYYLERQEFDQAIEMYQKAISNNTQSNKNIQYTYKLAIAFSKRAGVQINEEAKNKDISFALQCIDKAFVRELPFWEKVIGDFQNTPTINEPRFQQLYKERHPGTSIPSISKVVSFDIAEEGGKNKVTALEILINNKTITRDTLILPDSLYDVEVRFKEYETVKRQIYFERVQEQFVLVLPLKRLRKYDFSLNKNELLPIDAIDYNLKLYADSILVEDHLVELAKSDKSMMCQVSMRVPRESSIFRAEVGYNYFETDFVSLKPPIKLTRIDSKLLQEHLTKVARTSPEGQRAALSVIVSLFKNPGTNSRLSCLPMAELDSLYLFVGEWTFSTLKDKEQHNLFLEGLQTMIQKADHRENP